MSRRADGRPPERFAQAALRRWQRWRLQGRPHLAELFEPPPPGEWVALDCEATGFDRERDELVSISAVPIVGRIIRLSQRLELRLRTTEAEGEPAIEAGRPALTMEEAMTTLVRFVGSRPIVGYYLDFDLALLDRAVRPWLGTGLPNARIDISELYYAREASRRHALTPGPAIDLRFESIMGALDVPPHPTSDPLSNATRTAIAFLALQEESRRDQ